MGGREVRALVDTGCTTTMVRSSLVGERVGESWMSAFDGRKVRCGGERPMNLEVRGTPVEVSAVAIEHLVGDLDVVLGMDAIEQLGGVMVRNDGVDFGVGRCLMAQKEEFEREVDRWVEEGILMPWGGEGGERNTAAHGGRATDEG